jgi:hypothetical protein
MRYLALFVIVFALPLFAAAATPYHLELEATPQAAFPYLGRFGTVDLHVYDGGVSAKALWLSGFSRNGDRSVTIANPLGRMYVEIPIGDIAPSLSRLAGRDSSVERQARPTMGPALRGTVKGVAATRHRLLYGPSAWIDVWTTDVIPPNTQLRELVAEAVSGISPGTGAVARRLPGTPIYVELNFRRFKKVPLVKLKKLTFAAEDEASALELGSFYVRAGVLEKIFD